MSENNQIFNISFPKELLKKVDAIADEQFGSRSEFLRTACQEYIRRDEAWKALFVYGKKFGEQGDAESESDVALKVNEMRSIGVENLTDLERNQMSYKDIEIMSQVEEETLEAVKKSGHTVKDIKFIGSIDGYSCTWEEFVKLAEQDDENYYSGFGGQTLATDLIVYFTDNTYMKRVEYDGSEGWEHNEPLELPTETKTIKHIANGDSWASLEEMNKPDGKYGE